MALFDITAHLTDKEALTRKYNLYSNLNSLMNYVSFEYVFEFNSLPVLYRYKKTDVNTLLDEELIIGDISVISYDFSRDEGKVLLKGAEQLNLSASHSPISRVKYVSSNAILDPDDDINKAFAEFMDYVNHMLLFYSLDEKGYQGFQNGIGNIEEGIIQNGKLIDFQNFLAEVSGQKFQLLEKQVNGNPCIYCKFKNEEVSFFSIASAGTRSLALFYYWYLRMQDASFVFIDEFDAFYHFELAKNIIVLLRELTEQQIVLTTHNTDLLSNELLRPDCYFLIGKKSIVSLPNATDKDLRKAHNLQKMYKSGAFHA